MTRSAMLAFVAALAVPAPSYAPAASYSSTDGGWDLLSVASADRRLYVARSDGVTAVDLKTGKVTDRIVGGSRVHAALAIPGTHDVLATNGQTNTATLFDGRNGVVRATLPTGTKPDAAAYDPATKTVWVMDPGSGQATVIDPAAAKVLATVEVGGSLELAAADGQGRLFVNIEDQNRVAVIDTRRRTVTARVALPGCDGPTGIAYDPASRQILSACGNGVAVVTGADGRHVANLPIGRGADGAAFDARRGLALVPAGRDGNVTLIRLGAKPQVVGRFATTASARTIALDQATGRVYLPAATMAPAVGQDRPKGIPGSFRILAYAPKN